MTPESSEGYSTGIKTPKITFSGGPRRGKRIRRRVRQDAWEADQPCKKCGGGSLTRIHRETLLDFLVSGFGCYPFTCGNCHKRSSRIDPVRLAGGICVSVLACGFLMVALLDSRSLYRVREQKEKALQLALPPAVPALSLPNKLAVPPPRRTGALTNGDIVDMVKGGMSDSFIRDLVHQTENRFIVDSQSLVELKNEHVPESVILSMVEAAKQSENRGRADSTASAGPGN